MSPSGGGCQTISLTEGLGLDHGGCRLLVPRCCHHGGAFGGCGERSLEWRWCMTASAEDSAVQAWSSGDPYSRDTYSRGTWRRSSRLSKKI